MSEKSELTNEGSIEDLPKEEQHKYKPVDGGGFVKITAEDDVEMAHQEALDILQILSTVDSLSLRSRQVGIREKLSVIKPTSYIPGLEERISILRRRFSHFKKIVRECDRILSDMSREEKSETRKEQKLEQIEQMTRKTSEYTVDLQEVISGSRPFLFTTSTSKEKDKREMHLDPSPDPLGSGYWHDPVVVTSHQACSISVTGWQYSFGSNQPVKIYESESSCCQETHPTPEVRRDFIEPSKDAVETPIDLKLEKSEDLKIDIDMEDRLKRLVERNLALQQQDLEELQALRNITRRP